jgi:hydroxyethylthiazole kinase-like uncharacterized protein yjeF
VKVIAAKEMSRIEAIAFTEGSSGEEFMYNAGSGIANVIEREIAIHEHKKQVTLLCGKGNNAGDAYVAGTLLTQKGYQVEALQLVPSEQCSPLCQNQIQHFQEKNGKIRLIKAHEQIELPSSGILLDGILGTGFHGKVEGLFHAAISKANQSLLPTIAIDIPSGLNGNTGETGGIAIEAFITIFLCLPKTGFFIRNGWKYMGKLQLVDFGLKTKYVNSSEEDFITMTHAHASSLLPPILRNRHKYQAGYVVGIAGSPGMPGAAILASYAALRCGAGIVRLLHPDGMQAELANSPYELIKQAFYTGKEEELIPTLNDAAATFIGPGLGSSEGSKTLLRKVLPKIKKPCVIDADALNILSMEKISLPQYTVMTPHSGEMHRLLGLKEKHPLNMDFIHLCSKFSKENNVTLILKGSPSFVFQPKETPFVIPYGDPGMATAGTGDVLTGIVASLLAQGLSTKNAACLGVYLHALAGEHASKQLTSYSVIASDLIDALPFAYKLLI